jgi:hypothetical protein
MIQGLPDNVFEIHARLMDPAWALDIVLSHLAGDVRPTRYNFTYSMWLRIDDSFIGPIEP